METLAAQATEHFPVGDIRDKRICVYKDADETWMMHVEGRGHIEITEEIALLYVNRQYG